MSKKPRNKKYNPERNYARAAKHIVKDIVVIFTIGYEPQFIDIKHGKQVQLSQTLWRAFYSIQHQWRLYSAVLLETSQGERYANINEIAPERPCYMSDITSQVTDIHLEQAKKTKKSDRVNLGWVSNAAGREMTEAEVVKLLELFPDCWTRHERGSVLLDEELTIDQKLQRELEAI